MMKIVKKVMPFLAVTLVVCIAVAHAHSLEKRDVKDDIDEQLPQGALCINQDQCSFIEYCDREGLNFHCRLTTWFIATVVALAVVLLLTFGISCICCPCCCLYAMCRKS